MTHHESNPVRELLEQARQLRRSQQPPAALFEATLERLAREEHAQASSSTRQLARRRPVMQAWRGTARWILRPGFARVAPALALALAVVVGWRALRPRAAVDQAPPPVAIAPEPAPSGKQQAGVKAGSASTAPMATPPPTTVIPPIPQPAEADRRTGRVGATVRARNAKCEPPFWTDADGIKRLKMACLASSPACEPPWFSDSEGVLRMKPGCSSPAGSKERAEKKPPPSTKGKRTIPRPAVPGCEPPSFIDPNGILRLKPNCL